MDAPSPSSPARSRELERRAADGGLDGCILKARVVSDDRSPTLADRLAEWSPQCAVFELTNTIANSLVKPIDPASENDAAAEPALDDLFREWRATAARASRRPHDAVGALLAQALGSAGQDAGADFGLTPLASSAQEDARQTSRRSGTPARRARGATARGRPARGADVRPIPPHHRRSAFLPLARAGEG